MVPNKVFDALACQRPVVTADTPAARECLLHGRDAWLCRAGDADALAEAIATLKADPGLRGRLAERRARAVSPSLLARCARERPMADLSGVVMGFHGGSTDRAALGQTVQPISRKDRPEPSAAYAASRSGFALRQWFVPPAPPSPGVCRMERSAAGHRHRRDRMQIGGPPASSASTCDRPLLDERRHSDPASRAENGARPGRRPGRAFARPPDRSESGWGSCSPPHRQGQRGFRYARAS